MPDRSPRKMRASSSESPVEPPARMERPLGCPDRECAIASILALRNRALRLPAEPFSLHLVGHRCRAVSSIGLHDGTIVGFITRDDQLGIEAAFGGGAGGTRQARVQRFVGEQLDQTARL